MHIEQFAMSSPSHVYVGETVFAGCVVWIHPHKNVYIAPIMRQKLYATYWEEPSGGTKWTEIYKVSYPLN